VTKPIQSALRFAVPAVLLLAISAGCAKRVELFRPGATNVGYASWYGADFHGRRTASGEVYDMNARTAAHREAPFGTRVRVTNLSNERSTEVRINDRGPFVKGRIIDLSYAAAKEIGLVGTGTAKVELAFLGTAPPPPAESPPAAATGDFFLQVGSFKEEANARAFLDEARQRFPKLPGRISSSEGLHRVWIGPFATEADTRNTSARLKDAGYETVLLRR
jgi:rare lipoprotein A